MLECMCAGGQGCLGASVIVCMWSLVVCAFTCVVATPESVHASLLFIVANFGKSLSLLFARHSLCAGHAQRGAREWDLIRRDSSGYRRPRKKACRSMRICSVFMHAVRLASAHSPWVSPAFLSSASCSSSTSLCRHEKAGRRERLTLGAVAHSLGSLVLRGPLVRLRRRQGSVWSSALPVGERPA